MIYVKSKREAGAKQAQILTMFARDEGASGPQIAEALGWVLTLPAAMMTAGSLYVILRQTF
jgi:phosphate/sulfate permease